VNPTGRHRDKKRRHGAGTIVRRSERQGDDHHRSMPFVKAISLGTDPQTGKRRRRFFYGRTREEAEQRATKAMAALAPDAAGATSVGEMLDLWLDDTKRSIKPNTWNRYELAVEGHLVPTLGEVRLAELTPASIRAAIPLWKSAHNRWYVFSRLRQAIGWALRQDPPMLARDPSYAVSAPAKPRVEDAPVIDAPRARAILAALEADPHGTLGLVYVVLGLRRGEALGLQWRYIDFEAGTLKTPCQLQVIAPRDRTPQERAAGAWLRLVETKRERSDRLLPMPEHVAAALRARRAAQAAEREAAGAAWAGTDLVFTDAQGYPWPPNSVSRHIARALARAGLGDLCIRDLRHAASTLLSLVGAHERVQMGILGHTRPAQSLAYTGFVPEEARRAMGDVEALLAPPAKPDAIASNGCPDGCPDGDAARP
jgi:integrase